MIFIFFNKKKCLAVRRKELDNRSLPITDLCFELCFDDTFN